MNVTALRTETGLQPLFAVLTVIIAVLVSAGIGSGHLSLMATLSLAVVVGCLVLPWISAPFSLVVLGFAGRFEIAPFAADWLDVAFWTALGLGLSVFAETRGVKSATHFSHLIVLSLFAFLIAVAVSLIPTIGYNYAEDKAFRVILYAIVFMLFTQIILQDVKSFQNFLIVFIVFVSCMAMLSLAFAIQANGLLGIQRISPPGGGPITLARLLGFAVIASIGLVYFHPRKRLLLANAAFMTLIAFATGSRGPAIFLILLVLSFPFLAALNKRTRRQARGMIAAMSALTLLLFPVMQLALVKEVPFATRFVLLLEEERGASVTTREDFMLTGLRLASQFDYLGSGIGSWPLLTTGEDIIGYPHNIFIEILVEQGAVGLLVFVVFVLAVIATAVRSLLRASSAVTSGLMSVGLLSFLYALLIAQTSGDLYDNRYIWFFAAFILACTRVHNTKYLDDPAPDGDSEPGTEPGVFRHA